MSNENIEQTQFTHIEIKLAELREDRAKAQEKVAKIDEKIAALEAGLANEAAIAELKQGDQVVYVYGRALNKRVLSGIVAASQKNEKGIVQIKVQHGQGFDAEFHLIDQTSLLFGNEEIEAAQEAINKAKAEGGAA